MMWLWDRPVGAASAVADDLASGDGLALPLGEPESGVRVGLGGSCGVWLGFSAVVDAGSDPLEGV